MNDFISGLHNFHLWYVLLKAVNSAGANIWKYLDVVFAPKTL